MKSRDTTAVPSSVLEDAPIRCDGRSRMGLLTRVRVFCHLLAGDVRRFAFPERFSASSVPLFGCAVEYSSRSLRVDHTRSWVPCRVSACLLERDAHFNFSRTGHAGFWWLWKIHAEHFQAVPADGLLEPFSIAVNQNKVRGFARFDLRELEVERSLPHAIDLTGRIGHVWAEAAFPLLPVDRVALKRQRVAFRSIHDLPHFERERLWWCHGECARERQGQQCKSAFHGLPPGKVIDSSIPQVFENFRC
jgi:hypothetical protein